MSKEMQTRIYPETGAVLRRDRRVQTVRYATLSKAVEVEGWYPQGEGDSIHTGAELAIVEKTWTELKQRYAEHIRSSRKQWKLSQEEAGKLFGGGKRAFQKYETGKAAPSEAAVALIELVNAAPQNLERLRDIRQSTAKLVTSDAIVPKRGIRSTATFGQRSSKSSKHRSRRSAAAKTEMHRAR